MLPVPGRTVHFFASADKAKRVLGWRPQHNFMKDVEQASDAACSYACIRPSMWPMHTTGVVALPTRWWQQLPSKASSLGSARPASAAACPHGYRAS
jgi:hypothetical protein